MKCETPSYTLHHQQRSLTLARLQVWLQQQIELARMEAAAAASERDEEDRATDALRATAAAAARKRKEAAAVILLPLKQRKGTCEEAEGGFGGVDGIPRVVSCSK